MKDVLGLIAELSVGLTGFAAVVSALGHAPSDSDVRLDRFRLRNLVEVGVATSLLAVLPLMLAPEDPIPREVWIACDVALLIVVLFVTIVHQTRKSRLNLTQMAGYSRATTIAVYALGAGSLSLAALALAIPAIPIDQGYVGALFLGLALTCVYFLRVAASLLTPR